MNDKSLMQISITLEECIEKYIQERRSRVSPFVASHFSLQETIQIQKKSFLLDLLLNPLNAAWSFPYLFTKKIVESVDKLGWNKLNPFFTLLPSGVKTRYQKEIETLIMSELLEWSPNQGAQKNAFLAIMEKDPVLAKFLKAEKFSSQDLIGNKQFHEAVEANSASRVMISDLAGSFMTLLAGWLFFGDQSLGVVGIGNRIAHRIARDKAASNFFFGRGLGSAFYNAFPPEPSASQVALATLLVGLMLTFFSLVASVLSDPLRKKTGLQEKKLHALLDDLEERLLIQLKRQFKNAFKNAADENKVNLAEGA
jgi:hypothetical protein